MNQINDKIDHLGNDMRWMKNALIEWAKAIDHDDSTNALIDKYCKEDEKRANVCDVWSQETASFTTLFDFFLSQ